METFGKASQRRLLDSATVAGVGRRVARASAVALLALGGFASSIYAARPARGVPSGPTTATTGDAGTTGATPSITVSTAPTVLAFSGHGYGHGLGMSQWGAAGYAGHGLAYDRILAHYYPGTVLGRARPRTVRVLLAQERKTTIASSSAVVVTDDGGSRAELPAGKLVLKPALAVADHPELAPPLTFTSVSPLSLDGHPYRGRLVLSSYDRLVTTVDVVGLEQYVQGVVPAEMPSNWPAAALEAQAVAARSYALANLAKGKPFDLYGDVRSQVYGGVSVESEATSAAVDATKGQVLLYRGKVADTLFHSSSGGRTVSSLEATGLDVPYLVSVADPYDTLSPYHDWGPVLLDANKVRKRLKLGSPITELQTADGPSGRLKTLALTTADGSTATFTGMQLRTLLGLRSTWFQPDLLGLQPDAKTITYGGATTLNGVASGGGEISLEARAAGSAEWSPAGAVGRPDGTFGALVKPRATTSYRLVSGTARVGLVRVAVSARVSAAASPSGIAGSSSPTGVSVPVQLQARGTGGWTTVSATVADAGGGFSFGGTVPAGTYRVRVAPGHGVVPGVSAPLVVP